MNVDHFFSNLWKQYIDVAPEAAKIHQLFEADTPPVVNDHVAFRTFNLSPINITMLEPLIKELGSEFMEEYHFSEKKLYARSYYLENQPKIFLSEYLVSSLSIDNQQYIQSLCQQIDQTQVSDITVLTRGRLWEAPTGLPPSNVGWSE